MIGGIKVDIGKLKPKQLQSPVSSAPKMVSPSSKLSGLEKDTFALSAGKSPSFTAQVISRPVYPVERSNIKSAYITLDNAALYAKNGDRVEDLTSMTIPAERLKSSEPAGLRKINYYFGETDRPIYAYKNFLDVQLKEVQNPDFEQKIESLARNNGSVKRVNNIDLAKERIHSLSTYLKEKMIGYVTPAGEHWFEKALPYMLQGAMDLNSLESKKDYKHVAKEFFGTLGIDDKFWVSPGFVGYLQAMPNSPAVEGTIEAIRELNTFDDVDIPTIIIEKDSKYMDFSKMSEINIMGVPELYDYCAYSGQEMDIDDQYKKKPTFEHVLPKSYDGPSNDFNGFVVSGLINSKRGTVPLIPYLKGWNDPEWTSSQKSMLVKEVLHADITQIKKPQPPRIEEPSTYEYTNIFETPFKAEIKRDLKVQLEKLQKSSNGDVFRVYDAEEAAERTSSLSRYLKEDMVGFVDPDGTHWFEAALPNLLKGSVSDNFERYDDYKNVAKAFFKHLSYADDYWTSRAFQEYLMELKPNDAVEATIDAIDDLKKVQEAEQFLDGSMSKLSEGVPAFEASIREYFTERITEDPSWASDDFMEGLKLAHRSKASRYALGFLKSFKKENREIRRSAINDQLAFIKMLEKDKMVTPEALVARLRESCLEVEKKVPHWLTEENVRFLSSFGDHKEVHVLRDVMKTIVNERAFDQFFNRLDRYMSAVSPDNKQEYVDFAHDYFHEKAHTDPYFVSADLKSYIKGKTSELTKEASSLCIKQIGLVKNEMAFDRFLSTFKPFYEATHETDLTDLEACTEKVKTFLEEKVSADKSWISKDMLTLLSTRKPSYKTKGAEDFCIDVLKSLEKQKKIDSFCRTVDKALWDTGHDREKLEKMTVNFFKTNAKLDEAWLNNDIKQLIRNQSYLYRSSETLNLVLSAFDLAQKEQEESLSAPDAIFPSSSSSIKLKKIPKLTDYCAYSTLPMVEGDKYNKPIAQSILPQSRNGERNDFNVVMVREEMGSKRSQMPLLPFLKGWDIKRWDGSEHAKLVEKVLGHGFTTKS